MSEKGFSFVKTLKANTKGICDKTKIENNSKKYAYNNNNLIVEFNDKEKIYFYINEKLSTEE